MQGELHPSTSRLGYSVRNDKKESLKIKSNFYKGLPIKIRILISINEECPGQMGHLQIGKHGDMGIVNKKDNRNNLSSQQRRISELIYSRSSKLSENKI